MNKVQTNGTGQVNNLVPHTDSLGRAIALDAGRGLLFFSSWTNFGPGQGGSIRVYNLNTLSNTLVLNVPNSAIPDVEVDTASQTLYWTDWLDQNVPNGAIRSASSRVLCDTA